MSDTRDRVYFFFSRVIGIPSIGFQKIISLFSSMGMKKGVGYVFGFSFSIYFRYLYCYLFLSLFVDVRAHCMGKIV